MVVVTESWLNESYAYFCLSGYRVVARRDRSDGREGGGVIVFTLSDDVSVAHVHDSLELELAWCLIHSNVGPILLGAWYRPPDLDASSVDVFEKEWQEFSADVVGSILVGDFNVHNIRWLTFSSSNTAAGTRLWTFAVDHGFTQLVTEPTRNEYLLDLVLSDFASGVKTKVLPKVADHNAVLASVDISVEAPAPVLRHCWSFKSARWKALNSHFRLTD